MPTYTELVARHNSDVAGIEKFWARAVIELRWVDDKGRNRFEQGDGNLILSLPNSSALSIGKLGETRLWAGSNDEFFWLFDEMESPRKLFLGRHDGQAIEELGPARQRSPLPLKPVDLPRLLGIAAIADPVASSPAATSPPAVSWLANRFVIEPPGEQVRYHFNPISRRVERVELLDAAGQARLTSELSKAERMERTGFAVGPYLSSRLKIESPGQGGDIRLWLSAMTDDPERVNPRVFDLQTMKNIRKPEQIIPVAR